MPLLIDLMVLSAAAIVVTSLALLAKRLRKTRRGGLALGAAMAAYDEAMRSTAYDTFVEMQAQTERTTPPPAPQGR